MHSSVLGTIRFGSGLRKKHFIRVGNDSQLPAHSVRNLLRMGSDLRNARIVLLIQFCFDCQEDLDRRSFVRCESGDLMNRAERITIDPEICHGKPTIRGLRYPVEMILELLSSGMTLEEILVDYDDLEREDILAALSFATRLSQIKRIEPALV